MTVARLGPDTVGGLAGADLPRYDRGDVTAGVVHVGLGAFGRAHVARYCEDLLDTGDPHVAIVGASLRTGAVTAALGPQGGLYTLIESDGGDPGLRVVGAVTGLAHGSDVAAHIAAANTTAVTVTVTEKGYCTDPCSGHLDRHHPDVLADLADPSTSRSLPGVLVEGLAIRRRQVGSGLAVVSCDNLPRNGAVARAVVTDLALIRDDDLAGWIDANVEFPSTVVDRIVPAATDADRDLVASRIGVRDEAPVRAEVYRSWVIERCGHLPDWDRVGAVLTDDLTPYQDRKLRLVNALHSAAAYLGLLAGYETIDSAIADTVLRSALFRLGVDEIVATLPSVGEVAASGSPDEVVAGVLDRFANASLGHRCAQVAADGSQKLGPRILSTAAIRHRNGDPSTGLATVVAAWVAQVEAARRSGTALVDPLGPRLLDAAATPGDADRVRALLGLLAAPAELLGGLLDNAAFVDAVVEGRRRPGLDRDPKGPRQAERR